MVPEPYDFTGYQRYTYTGNNPLNAIDRYRRNSAEISQKAVEFR
jgi:hypothetical protein